MPTRDPSLAEAAVLLAESLDSADVFARVQKLVVSHPGDWFAVYVRERGAVRLVAGEDRSGLDALAVAESGMGQRAQHAVAAPMHARAGCVGALCYGSRSQSYSEEDLEDACVLARHAALAWENARLFERERDARADAERAMDRILRLHSLATILAEAESAHTAAELAARAARDAVTAQAGFVWLLDTAGTSLQLAANVGQGAEVRRVPLEARWPACDVIRTGLPVILRSRDERLARYPELPPADTGASASLPLRSRSHVLGVLSLSFATARDFSHEDVTFLLMIAQQCASAVERAALLEQKEAALVAAEAADRRKDQFLAMLGHELRNPLAPITTAIQLMKMKGLGGDKERDVIERQVKHLTRLVDDLLDLSRITRGKVELRKERLELATAIAKAVEMASPLFEKHAHNLEVTVEADVEVEGDPVRLAQVFQNLLTNAAKYTPPGGHIVVRGGRVDGEVVVQVRDDGVGIAPQLLPRIFEAFVQGERTMDRADGGLGLGLTLVRQFVTLHGGAVSAWSEGPGKGAEFEVRLPHAQPKAATDPTLKRILPAAKPRRKVLIVDDNADAATTLADMIRLLGSEVRIALDGPQALVIAQQFAPDLALLDIGLPVMDGYELCTKLREQHTALETVAISGYGQSADRARAHAAGFTRHLVKPVDAGALEALFQ